MPIVYIGIGSNLGDRRANCLTAVSLLEDAGLRINRRSSIHETEPWGLKDQPDFLNMAIEAETDLSPEELLDILKKIEQDMGREDQIKWGPRVIDLDILLYDDLILRSDELTIPHPFMHERDFVLAPLSEIAPQKIHPLLQKSIIALHSEN